MGTKRKIVFFLFHLFMAVNLIYLAIYSANLQREKDRMNERYERLLTHSLALLKNIQDVEGSLLDLDSKSKSFVEGNNRQLQSSVRLSEDSGWELENLADAGVNDKDSEQIPVIAAANKSLGSVKNHLSISGERIKWSEDRASSIPSLLPAQGPINSGYGYRQSPLSMGEELFHKGLDIGATHGSAVLAAANGTVIVAEPNGRYGNFISIAHGFGFKTRYAHLSRFTVKKGQKVKRGDKIGEVGNSGRTTGAHLHYEVLLMGHPIDPVPFLSQDEEGAYVPKVRDTGHLTLFEPQNLNFAPVEEDPFVLKLTFGVGLALFTLLLLALFFFKVVLAQKVLSNGRKPHNLCVEPVSYWKKEN